MLLALLRFPSDVLWLLPTLVVAGALCWVVLQRCRGERVPIAWKIFLVIGVMILATHYLLPSTARAHRAYYQGKSQFEWADQLRRGDTTAKSEAVAALCE